MVVFSKTDLRFPESGQQGHGARIIQGEVLPIIDTYTESTEQRFGLLCTFLGVYDIIENRVTSKY